MSREDQAKIMIFGIGVVVGIMFTIVTADGTYIGPTQTVEKKVCVQEAYAWEYAYSINSGAMYPDEPRLSGLNFSADYVESVSDYGDGRNDVWATLNYSAAVEAGVVEFPEQMRIKRVRKCVDHINVTVEVGNQ